MHLTSNLVVKFLIYNIEYVLIISSLYELQTKSDETVLNYVFGCMRMCANAVEYKRKNVQKKAWSLLHRYFCSLRQNRNSEWDAKQERQR